MEEIKNMYIKSLDESDVGIDSILNKLRDMIRCLDNELIEIECDNDGNFYIGKVVKILNNCIYFLELDPHGIWDDEPFIINYKDIDGIKWNTWYLNGWKWYFENKN